MVFTASAPAEHVAAQHLNSIYYIQRINTMTISIVTTTVVGVVAVVVVVVIVVLFFVLSSVLDSNKQ